ncbi:hypothetical protein Tco_0987707, partial [Tanacetum coccineum]
HTLVLATSSVVDLMKEVDELKQTPILEKEANDMHAGEVCVEKAILATEMKELQLCLFTMSDEILLNALVGNVIWPLPFAQTEALLQFLEPPYVVDQSEPDQSPASSIFRDYRILYLHQLLAKVDLFASPPTAVVAASSPSIDFFCRT